MSFLFNSGGQKDGPGISRNEPQKRGFFRFIDIIARKYSKLIGLNILYFLCSLPVAAAYFLLSSIIVPNIVDVGTENYQYNITALSFYISFFFLMTLGGGPFTAGFAYVIRNFSREEHAFVVSDFFEYTKKNLRQSLIVTFLDFLLIFLLFVNINFYSVSDVLDPFVAYAAKIAMLIFTALYMISRMYLYSLMVTFDAKLGTLYKYSYILSILKLPQNIILFAVNIALYSLASLAPFGFFTFFITPFFLLSLTYLSQSMYTTAVIKENIFFDKKEQKNNENQIFTD